MDFSLTEEQRLLQESVQRFVQDSYSFEQRRAIMAQPDGFSRDTWAQFAEMGWLALPFDEADGGLGGGPVDTLVMLEALGEGLVVEPLMATVLLAGRALACGGDDAQKAEWLTPLLEGRLLAALAAHERRGRHAPGWVETRAARVGEHWRLDGEKSAVLHGDCADLVLVSARTAGSPEEPKGISLFAVPADSDGLSRQRWQTIDGLSACELTLAAVKLPPEALVGEQDAGLGLIEAVLDEAAAAQCAEAVGAMVALTRITADYLRQRKQFGQPLAAFQVLQHRLADMFMDTERSRSLAVMAALQARAGDVVTRQRAVSAAKVQAGRSGRFVGQQAVQLHGGIGISDELSVGHYFKRLTALDARLGSADWHLARFAAQPASG